MNEPNIPPLIPQAAAATAAAAPAWSADDQEPISGVGGSVEAMLRQPRRVLYHLQSGGAGRVIGFLSLVAIVCAGIYGLVVGSFSGGTQYWAAPLKIVLGLAVSGLICLPSLYIFACLSGAKTRLAEVAGLVAGAVALMSVLLIGFAPVAWVFSQSTNSLVGMGALHLLFWVVAIYFGLRFVSAGFEHRGAHAGGINVWMIIFLVVMLQMTTALRPILGTSDTFLPKEKRFFLQHWVQNFDAAQAR